MFEPQDHPDNFPVPGAPPTRPYDNAGWTLAFQMGVEFDRILDAFTGPFEVIPDWNVTPPPAACRSRRPARTPRRLPAARRVRRREPAARRGRSGVAPAGRVRRRRQRPASTPIVQKARGRSRRELHVDAARRRPPARGSPSRRIGLWDQYGGSMDAGWARWILEQFEFPFDARLRAGARRRQSEREVRHADLRRRRDSRRRRRAAAAAVAVAAAGGGGGAREHSRRVSRSDRPRVRRPHAAAAASSSSRTAAR